MLVAWVPKFSPDWCFGLLKQRFRRTFVSSLRDLFDVVNASADVNVAQLVGTQDGKVIIPSYDWASFLGERFRKVPQMKSYHNFFFSGKILGSVVLEQFSDSDSSSFKMLIDNSWIPSPSAPPPVISPSGLSCARQWYLYNEIP